jgi:hypothetical protein
LEAEMKKLIVVLLFLMLMAPLFAQSNSQLNSESEFYCVNIRIERIYPTTYGYIVQYRKGLKDTATVSVHNEWLAGTGGKAELVYLPKGTNWPSMTLFYKNGEFDHIRLYVHKYRSHPTWGNVHLPADLTPYFANPDDIHIEY